MTPAQKRRRSFNSREDWAKWAVQVVKSMGGMVQINTYEERSGSRDLHRGCEHARKLGLLSCIKPYHPARKMYVLAKTKEARP